MFLLAKYNTQTTFTFCVVKRAVVDLAVSADWTPATGDTKVSKDGGAVANTTNNPVAVSGTGSAQWSITLTAAELSAAEVTVQIVDSATKAVEDQFLRIYTYGNASAKIPFDFSDTVRAGLTALPNVASGSAGAIITSGTGTAQLSVTSGVASANVTQFGGAAGTFASGRPEVNTTHLGGVQTPSVIARGTASGTPTTTSIPTSAMSPAGAAADQFKGRIIIFDTTTTTTALRGQATDITASSNAATPTLTVTALTTAPVSGDTFTIV